ncbi:hypothetical protein DLAC_09838 [Tieghemostelium lacteum]|uniref:Uncharacterized protein n=1 Tax=Tieghemostelium lacteum TaxID=361077 RepID=A0A151Z7C4_TIELA|nr:hypothetical protein DLAC_09838 [Tieghemostelium lacteum]|eukprot:KYQ89863.1 hypothetical protein DLAC_09838 [Tieghemostelium lacteum]
MRNMSWNKDPLYYGSGYPIRGISQLKLNNVSITLDSFSLLLDGCKQSLETLSMTYFHFLDNENDYNLVFDKLLKEFNGTLQCFKFSHFHIGPHQLIAFLNQFKVAKLKVKCQLFDISKNSHYTDCITISIDNPFIRNLKLEFEFNHNNTVFPLELKMNVPRLYINQSLSLSTTPTLILNEISILTVNLSTETLDISMVSKIIKLNSSKLKKVVIVNRLVHSNSTLSHLTQLHESILENTNIQ